MSKVRVQVQVRDLRADDVLAGSGQRVECRPFDSARCPSGKINVVTSRGSKSTIRTRVWGKYTRVTVLRDA